MPVNVLAIRCVLWLTTHPTAKVSEKVNRKRRQRNMMVQLSIPYTLTAAERHNTLRRTQTKLLFAPK